MKKNTLLYISAFLLLTTSSINAQVGIGTNSPKGLLDINSSNSGIIYPSVALTSTQLAAPVVNPATGDNVLVNGTTIYNTNTTTTGTNDVEPGIYSWDATNTEWVTHFFVRQVELFKQTSTLRTEAVLGFENVPGLGLTDGLSFTAKYSGLYRIELKVNHGGGAALDNDEVNGVMTEGDFRLNWDGANNDFRVNAISSFNQDIGAGTHYVNSWAETFKVIYVNLTAQQTYNFYLQFDAFSDANLIGGGSTGVTTTTSVVDLINDDFEGVSTVSQFFIPDGGCSVQGWTIASTTRRCTSGCFNRVLYIRSNNSSCTQNATAFHTFTPTQSMVNVDFDYGFQERSGRNDRFRVYLHDGTSQVGGNLVSINNSGSVNTNSSYSGSLTVTPGTTYTLRYEYINGNNNARWATVDNVVISETITTVTPDDTGRGYVGGDVPCFIEISYIDEN